MTLEPAIARWSAFAMAMSASGQAPLPEERPTLELVVAAGTPLRVALHERLRMQEAGQRVNGTLVEPIYAYDRMVLPAGTRALGSSPGSRASGVASAREQ